MCVNKVLQKFLWGDPVKFHQGESVRLLGEEWGEDLKQEEYLMKSAGRKIFKNLASNSSNIERREYKWEHYPWGKKKNVWQIPGNPG